MPLHLLGKKSWNVYNPENIAKVKRDEAAAKTLQDVAEREQRDNVAGARLQILRGESPELGLSEVSQRGRKSSLESQAYDTRRRKRKLAGEDDTDRDIRLARADIEAPSTKRRDVAAFDSKGDLGPISQQQTKRDVQDRSRVQESGGMRFEDASGYKSNSKPWYTSSENQSMGMDAVSRNVWGDEDPRRREREQHRTNANDPLLAMKKGVKQLRENERQRQDWLEQRERDLYEVERLARASGKKKRRRSIDEDSIEAFSLDAPIQDQHLASTGKHREHKHRRRRSRQHSQSPDRRKHRHRHSRKVSDTR